MYTVETVDAAELVEPCFYLFLRLKWIVVNTCEYHLLSPRNLHHWLPSLSSYVLGAKLGILGRFASHPTGSNCSISVACFSDPWWSLCCFQAAVSSLLFGRTFLLRLLRIIRLRLCLCLTILRLMNTWWLLWKQQTWPLESLSLAKP